MTWEVGDDQLGVDGDWWRLVVSSTSSRNNVNGEVANNIFFRLEKKYVALKKYFVARIIIIQGY
jgi:hypothetical protein